MPKLIDPRRQLGGYAYGHCYKDVHGMDDIT
jgi:hypothetical protein